MPSQRVNADDKPRFLMVNLSREQLRGIEKRRDAFNEPHRFEAPPGHPRTSGLRISVDQVASRLLAWAIEHAPEPLP